MGGASSYLSILAIACFLVCGWLATKVSQFAGVSSIVLEITTGLILGPEVVGVIGKEYAECAAKREYDCRSVTSNFDELWKKDELPASLNHFAKNKDLCNEKDYKHEDKHDDDADHENGDKDKDKTDGDADKGHGDDDGAADGDKDKDDNGRLTPGRHHRTLTIPIKSDNQQHRRLSGGGDYKSFEDCVVKSCEAEFAHECQLYPDFFTLVGHTGVAMMIFESGMHFDFEKAACTLTSKACVVAVIGTLMPLITGCLLAMAYGSPFFPDGVSVGTALAPTSVGIALRLLGEAKVLAEDFGQAIITAAFFDDILSLTLFTVLFNLREDFSLRGDSDWVPVAIFTSVVVVFPRFLKDFLLPKIKKINDVEGEKVPRKDQALFLVMVMLLIAYGTIGHHFWGTHLWGCFFAGMAFACIDKNHHPHHVWVRQTKRWTSWMIRIFFSATVAFSIPLESLFSFEAFWKGSLMGIGPCILTKVLCAPFMGPARWVIGWAMVGRAEFAYLIAQMAASAGMVTKDTFSIVIWALLYATIFAPFIFRKVLNMYVQQYCKDVVEEPKAENGPYDDHAELKGDG